MKLQVGMTLHYWPSAIHGKQPLAAVVILCRRDNLVDVSVFTLDGKTMAVLDVPVLGLGDTAEGAHCTWPAQDQSTPTAQAARAGYNNLSPATAGQPEVNE